MVTPREILAIVQARGGSKGLPGKNLRLLDGHPLVAWSIASSLASTRVTRTIMSTDSDAIAEAARAYGAEVPFIRPSAIARDDTPDLPVFQHALDWLWHHERYRPDIVVQLRPTTPLRPKGFIDQAIEGLESDETADCVRGVTVPKQTPFKMWRAGEGGYLEPLMHTEFAEPYNMPRQKLPPVYWQTGHVDVIRTRTILEQQSLTGRRVRPIHIDAMYCVDVDTKEDFDAVSAALAAGTLDIDRPASASASTAASLPDRIDLLVFDFDGVMTDNRVFILQDGREGVLCDRSDGLGISQLRHLVPIVVISTETNPVVSARCAKLKIECLQGVNDKVAALRSLAETRSAALKNTIFVGNDVNDLACLQIVGCAVAPADAHPQVRPHVDVLLSRAGGRGAVRELCDMVLRHLSAKDVRASKK